MWIIKIELIIADFNILFGKIEKKYFFFGYKWQKRIKRIIIELTNVLTTSNHVNEMLTTLILKVQATPR